MTEDQSEARTPTDDQGSENAKDPSPGGAENWAPWGTLSELQDAVGGFVDSALRSVTPGGARFPRCDLVAMSDGGYRLSLDLPGLEKSDVDLTIVGRELTIAGERKRPQLDDGAEIQRTERTFGKFRRTVRLPDDAGVDRVSAKMTNGVLEISLGPVDPDEAQTIEVE